MTVMISIMTLTITIIVASSALRMLPQKRDDNKDDDCDDKATIVASSA